MVRRCSRYSRLTLIGFFFYPGHTILQSDTQIYIPILEHIEDPSLLRNDIMAVRPHVSFTLYDESALLLRRLTGLSFEQVLRVSSLFIVPSGCWESIFLRCVADWLPGWRG